MTSSCPIVTISRKESFSSAHRLHSIYLSDEENLKTYGKCNSINGHGHNYTVEISVRGPVDRKNGMVMNLVELKDIMNEAVMKPLDHKNIDKDVAYFKKIPSTAENIAVFIWDAVREKMPQPELLQEVKLWETDKNIVSYHGKQAIVKPPFNRRMSENIIAELSSDSE